MFEQGTPGPSANSNMIERLTNLSSKGAEPQRPIEGLRRHLRIDPKRSDLVLHAAMRGVRFGSKAALTAPKSDVRFTPHRGLLSDIARGPKSARTGSRYIGSALSSLNIGA